MSRFRLTTLSVAPFFLLCDFSFSEVVEGLSEPRFEAAFELLNQAPSALKM